MLAYIHTCMWDLQGLCGNLDFSGLDSENSLFYSVLRRPAMFEMAHHKPRKCLFLQCLQLVPAKFLVNKKYHICELHFALRFLEFLRKPKFATLYLKHTYIHTYIHTYSHTYMHACIHTYILACWWVKLICMSRILTILELNRRHTLKHAN